MHKTNAIKQVRIRINLSQLMCLPVTHFDSQCTLKPKHAHCTIYQSNPSLNYGLSH